MKLRMINDDEICQRLSKNKVVVFLYPHQEDLSVDDALQEIEEIYEINISEEMVNKTGPKEDFWCDFVDANILMIEFENRETAHSYIMRLYRKRETFDGYACMYVDGDFWEEST